MSELWKATETDESIKRVSDMREEWKSRLQSVKEKMESLNKELNDLNLTRLALDGAIQGAEVIIKDLLDSRQQSRQENPFNQATTVDPEPSADTSSE